jgi:hypothetical protein
MELKGKNDFTETGSYYYRARVIKDTDGFLASVVAASPPPTPELSPDLCEQADNLYGLLARLRGREPYDVRFAERFLRPDELVLLYAAWPSSPEREAIRRAVRGVWEWTRYVWTEAEQTLGESLGIRLDAEALLAALERPYGWE